MNVGDDDDDLLFNDDGDLMSIFFSLIFLSGFFSKMYAIIILNY